MCGEHGDEHAPEPCKDEDGGEYSFDTRETWSVQTDHATWYQPAEWATVCERCAPKPACGYCHHAECRCP